MLLTDFEVSVSSASGMRGSDRMLTCIFGDLLDWHTVWNSLTFRICSSSFVAPLSVRGSEERLGRADWSHHVSSEQLVSSLPSFPTSSSCFQSAQMGLCSHRMPAFLSALRDIQQFVSGTLSTSKVFRKIRSAIRVSLITPFFVPCWHFEIEYCDFAET